MKEDFEQGLVNPERQKYIILFAAYDPCFSL
jgi:hypothetical protein